MNKNNQVKEAVRILNAGGIVIFPTDTAYGIGCRIDNQSAVDKLFRIRKRPRNQAVPVLVDSVYMAGKYLISPLSDNVRRIMDVYWPGGLTVVAKCRENLVTPLVRGGGKTLGVRMPDHALILQIIRGVAVPVLGPSANFHGDKTPYAVPDLNPDLVCQVDYVVSGICKYKKSSTVIDTSSLPWKILRQGNIMIDTKNMNDKIPVYKLYLDSSSQKFITVKLFKNGIPLSVKSQSRQFTSQILLTLIDGICRENKISPRLIDEVEFNRGPGSFTGLKVGASIANAFGWYLKISVNGKKNKIIKPLFD